MPNPLSKYLEKQEEESPLAKYSTTPQKENPLAKYLPSEKTNPLAKYEGRLQFQKMSPFGKALDIISRPGYAVKSLLKEEQRETLEGLLKAGFKGKSLAEIPSPIPPELEKAMIASKDITPEFFKRRGKALMRGLLGQERPRMEELIEEAGGGKYPLQGFALEVFTDPLMYGGYSAITKGIGKGLKLTKTTAMKIPLVAKGIAKAQEALTPMVTGLKNLFVNKTGFNELTQLVDKWLNKRTYLRGKEIKYAEKVRNVIQNISKKHKQSIPDIEKQIVSLIEQPNVPMANVQVGTRVLANTLREHFSNMLTTELKAGVPITHLSEGVKSLGYFPRITSREATKYLQSARKSYPGVSSKVWNTVLGNAKKRGTADFTLQEFNAFVEAHGLKSLGGRRIEQFFLQNPAYATAVRGIRSAKATTSAEFLKEAGQIFGKKTNPGLFEQLPNTVTRLNPSLKDLWFDPEVAREITKTTEKYFNQKEVMAIGRLFDSVQNLWKKWTLAPFPKYHIRNMVGNIWNNYLAGVGAEAYPKAQALQMYRKYKSKPGVFQKTAISELRKYGLTPQNADDIIRKAEETGVLGYGWYGADIETTMEKVLKGQRGLIGKGMAFGTTIENNARLAHFVDKLDKGMDMYQSAHSVKKFLFDYQDLTHFEKTTMKRLFPFYTWTRKNIPLQLEQLWKQPQKFAPLAVSLRSRDPKDLLRLKYARPDLYDRLPIELQRNVDTVTYVPLEGLIPAGDLSKMVRPQELILELMSPYLRAGIELTMNKSFYFESEIQKYPGETRELLRQDIPAKLKYALVTILPQARMLNEINKLVRKKVRKEELTPGEQVFSQALSSIYKIPLDDLQTKALQVIQRKINDLRMGARWAEMNERPRETQRIEKSLDKVMDEIERIE